MSKRTIDDEYESLGNDDKRIQRNRIHSEAHLKTVELLINLAKKLGNMKSDESSNDSMEIEEEQVSTYIQKPYWPVINKVNH